LRETGTNGLILPPAHDGSSTDPSTGFPKVGDQRDEDSTKGYAARKGDRRYAVIYEGLDPITGKERRRWHPAGETREEAEQLDARLAAEVNGRNDTTRSLTFGAYLTDTWLPGKRINLARSTWDGYRRKIDRHILPTPGRIAIRRLRVTHLEALYHRMLHPADGRRPLAPKTVLEVHLIIRGALEDAVRRGVVSRNVALVAHAPKFRSILQAEQKAWNAQQLQAFPRAAAGHRLFPPSGLMAATGMRRSERAVSGSALTGCGPPIVGSVRQHAVQPATHLVAKGHGGLMTSRPFAGASKISNLTARTAPFIDVSSDRHRMALCWIGTEAPIRRPLARLHSSSGLPVVAWRAHRPASGQVKPGCRW
jgi:hypothetical protein